MEHQILQLKALADEAEVTGQMSRALALHQKRVVLSDKANPQVSGAAVYSLQPECQHCGCPITYGLVQRASTHPRFDVGVCTRVQAAISVGCSVRIQHNVDCITPVYTCWL